MEQKLTIDELRDQVAELETKLYAARSERDASIDAFNSLVENYQSLSDGIEARFEDYRTRLKETSDEVTYLRNELEERDMTLLELAESTSPRAPQINEDYLRGWAGARRTLKVWFHDAYADMDNRLNIDLEKIPQDPGIKPLPENHPVEVIGRIGY